MLTLIFCIDNIYIYKKGVGMKKTFKKLRIRQVQGSLNKYNILTADSKPKNGWLKTIRVSLNMTGIDFAKKLNCSRINAIGLEKREENGTITLKTLKNAAAALNCRLVYALVPEKPLNQIMEDQARKIAKKQLAEVNHSMALEQQGLTLEQLTQQENDLVEELLSNPKNLWSE
jgi:predicted DNA-binding mobile mystery protein A